MIDDIKQETEERMGKALEALSHNFNKSCFLFSAVSPLQSFGVFAGICSLPRIL